ncbi:MAG: M28 family metallopeptidase [Deltaproteobacteria bacterium]
MKKTSLALFCLLFLTRPTLSCEKLLQSLGEKTSLADLVRDKKPWETIEANSEQRQPYYIGATPREFLIQGKQATSPVLPTFLKTLAERQSQSILERLGVQEVQFEIWPYLTDQGDPNWVFARYRENSQAPWHWLKSNHWLKSENADLPVPALPQWINPHQEKGHQELFKDFLEFDNLYQKPAYQEAIWTRNRASEMIAAWISPSEKNTLLDLIAQDPSVRARLLPQPSRFNDSPKTFVVAAQRHVPLNWMNEKIRWREITGDLPPKIGSVVDLSFSPQFDSGFKNDVRILSGEEEAIFPISKKKMRFTQKSSAQPDHQLGDVVDYLAERYQRLGLVTKRQPFTWRGIPQSNLIAIIPGKNRKLSPIVFADHFDTAFAEDHFSKTHERITNPGADDNATATASLLRAAEELKEKQPERDIWLLHLTGEEFPSDDLGVRHFMKELLKERKDIAGMILVDMIGIRDANDPVFQINGGQSQGALQLSRIAMQSAQLRKSPFKPAYRSRFDDKSYLYNTDGYILDSLGFPVVFFNEHLNRHTMGHINSHYHQTTDLSPNVDFEYATHISKIAITTLWNAALR